MLGSCIEYALQGISGIAAIPVMWRFSDFDVPEIHVVQWIASAYLVMNDR
jgi:hypothetical protein